VLKHVESNASLLGVQVVAVKSNTLQGGVTAFPGAGQQGGTPLIFCADAFFSPQGAQNARAAAPHRLPAIRVFYKHHVAGCLISYGQNVAEFHRRAATYVDKILKGTKPQDLPVEQPTKFDMVINLKTAKEFDLVVPQSLLATADEVIE